MSASHTPGPWKALDGGVTRVISTATYDTICTFDGTMRTLSTRPEIEAANARLIAAAPDLLEALRELEEWAVPNDEAPDRFNEAARKARAAIAKAEVQS